MEQLLGSEAQIQYLTEVLGVEQILRPLHISPSKRSKVVALVDRMSGTERDLFEKMLAAMKIEDLEVVEWSNFTKFDEVLLQTAPLVSIVFGTALGTQLKIENLRDFVDYQGVPTIVTYGPSELRENPALKAEAWKDMKLALKRLGMS